MSLVEFYGSRLRLRDLVQFGIVLKIQKRYEVQQNFINPINDCLVKMTQDILKRIFLGGHPVYFCHQRLMFTAYAIF